MVYAVVPLLAVETPTNACGWGGYDEKRLSGRMKEVVTLAIVGAAVGGGRKQTAREPLEIRKKEKKKKSIHQYFSIGIRRGGHVVQRYRLLLSKLNPNNLSGGD